MSSSNVQLRGASNQFANMSLSGDVNTQVAYRQHKVFPRHLLSGGTDFLDNCPSPGVLITADANNVDPVWVGGLGDDIAYVNRTYPGDNHGHPLYPGQSWVDPVDNANKITLAGTKNDVVHITCYLNQPTDVSLSTTPPPQYLPPILQSSNPVNNATAVSNISFMTAIFSQPLYPTTATIDNISISPTLAGFVVGVDSTNPDQIDMTCTPNSILANTTYTITFSVGLASLPNGFVNRSMF